MEPVTSVAAVRVLIARAKEGGRGFGTNFFLADAALEQAVSSGAMSAVEAEGAVALVQREELFHRVYYAAASPSAAAVVLAQVSAPVLVADVVGRPVDAEPWVAAFEQAGFPVYTRFQRMARMAMSSDAPEGAEIAGAGDAEEVRQAIADHFDPYAERIPPVEEVRHAAAAGNILIAREGTSLAAVLYYETQGVTTHLRFWLGLPEFRGRGYAHTLMMKYLSGAAGARRFILWVEQSNARAIPLYERYGYKRDGVEDVIVRKPAAQKR